MASTCSQKAVAGGGACMVWTGRAGGIPAVSVRSPPWPQPVVTMATALQPLPGVSRPPPLGGGRAPATAHETFCDLNIHTCQGCMMLARAWEQWSHQILLLFPTLEKTKAPGPQGTGQQGERRPLGRGGILSYVPPHPRPSVMASQTPLLLLPRAPREPPACQLMRRGWEEPQGSGMAGPLCPLAKG